MEFIHDTNAKFICPVCNTVTEHNCTQAELINRKALEFACQSCGRVFTQNSSGIEEATENKPEKKLSNDK